jgi:DNA-binding transcriptional ArsR family regulator
MEVISISNFPKERIYILLDKNYRRYLIQKSMKILNCKNYFELACWINKTSKTKFNGGDVKYWIKGNKFDKRDKKTYLRLMSLWLILKLIKLNNEKIENLYKHILSYRVSSHGLLINNPKLPIKVTPELDSIVIHLFGDGAAGDFTPSYTQKNKNSFDNFINKLKNCFGSFEKSIYFTQGKYQIKFPKAITDIISYYYSIKSYKSHEAKIPIKILKRKNRLYKLACLIAFIIDEGGIRDVITLYSSNRVLLYQIRSLVLNCGYSCSEIKFNIKSNSYHFSLSNKSIEKLYKDVQKLSKRYPTCNLSFKESQIRFIIKRRSNKNPKQKGVTNKIILNALEKENLTAQQISKLTGYAYCTIIHHLEKLYKTKKIKRIKTQNKIYLWKLY